MPATLNIAALARRTGVSADTLRKWEQRYGVLRPGRTPGGQRRYTELDVARVEWLRSRLAEGFRIGEAAALLGPAAGGDRSPVELRRSLVDATRRGDVAALGLAVEHALTLDALDDAFGQVLAPALVEIGALWEAGRLTVAQEHLASGTIRSALQRLLADRRAGVKGTAVLACAPGERHEIGLLMLAVLLRREGWQVAYLGPDTPVADAVLLARDLGASALVFSVTLDETAAALAAELRAAAVPPELRVLVGGRAGDGRSVSEACATLR